ncbi:hypothetical protein DFH29DRAFT_1024513 [Suillus ampliporus]|nr:hypothetical protein DFH29DRAFT_1024513 [Suillus ampliporus]
MSWSKSTYTYSEAVCLAMLGKHAEAMKLMERIQTAEAENRGEEYSCQALELAYVFHAIAHVPREVIAREMRPAVGGASWELGLVLSSEGSEGGSGGVYRKEGSSLEFLLRLGSKGIAQSSSKTWVKNTVLAVVDSTLH